MKMVKQKGARTGRAGKRRSVAAAMNRGAWAAAEDDKLVEYVRIHGDKNWRTVPEKAGLNRCGKSCRLRWLNYLRPGIKRGNMTEEEDDLIIRLHNLIGNRWSLIAARLPGRTDNEIKNYWNAHLGKCSLSLDDLNRKLYQKTQIQGGGGGEGGGGGGGGGGGEGGGGGTVVRPLPTRLASRCRRDFTTTMMSPILYHVDDDSAWIPPSRATSAHEHDPHLQVASSPDELMMTHSAVFDLDVDQLLDFSGGRISCSITAGGYTESGGEAQDFSVQGEASGTKFEGQAAVWELDDLDKLINCEEYLHGL